MLIGTFDKFEVVHISISQNKKTDTLSKLASVAFQHLAKDNLVKVLEAPSVKVQDIFVVDVVEDSWMAPTINYMVSGTLPESEGEVRMLMIRSLQYQLVEG